jgi:hypothetical protein
MSWRNYNTGVDYVDFQKDVIALVGAGKPCIQMQLTFNVGDHSCYLVFQSADDIAGVQEFGEGEIRLTWEEGLLMLGPDTPLPKELQ